MDNHTQRIAAVREAVQERLDLATGYKLAFEDHPAIWPCVGVYVQFAIARLAADLEHLAEHETAELGYEYHLQGIFGDGPRPEETQICEADALWYYRARTNEIARLLGLAQGGDQ